MATNTLIQYLEETQVTGLGGTVTVGASTSNRSQTETFVAGGTITVGQWVQFDTSASGASIVATVIPASAATATGNPLVCGVCIGSADSSGLLTAGHKVTVVVSGFVGAANVDAAVAAAGVALVVDNTGAGIANAYAAADLAPACGVSLGASAAGKAPVWVYKQF